LVRGWVPQQCGVWFPGPVVVTAEKAVTGFGPTASAASVVFVRIDFFGSGFSAAVQRGACFRVCAERVSVFVSSVTSPGRKGRRWKAVAPAAVVLFRQNLLLGCIPEEECTVFGFFRYASPRSLEDRASGSEWSGVGRVVFSQCSRFTVCFGRQPSASGSPLRRSSQCGGCGSRTVCRRSPRGALRCGHGVRVSRQRPFRWTVPRAVLGREPEVEQKPKGASGPVSWQRGTEATDFWHGHTPEGGAWQSKTTLRCGSVLLERTSRGAGTSVNWWCRGTAVSLRIFCLVSEATG